jgi:hypothetical protein
MPREMDSHWAERHVAAIRYARNAAYFGASARRAVDRRRLGPSFAIFHVQQSETAVVSRDSKYFADPFLD